MVLILSSKNDFTTNLVQDWLYYYGKKTVRINNHIKNIDFGRSSITLEDKDGENNNSINLSDIDSCWFRKGRLLISPNNGIDNSEYEVTKGYISFLLQSKRKIGNFATENIVNKLIVLELAKETGLKIPPTYIFEKKIDLKNLLSENQNKKYITKMKTDSCMFQFDDSSAIIYTNIITEDKLDTLPEKFVATLIQEKIEKIFEIRTFYLHGECWSMAIFSQNDRQTKDDYRRYNSQKPNRNTLFKLPIDLENKLHKLMQKLNLDTGSIDWILSNNHEYYFLEVNPTGQFSNLSMACNYSLEKLIAEKL